MAEVTAEREAALAFVVVTPVIPTVARMSCDGRVEPSVSSAVAAASERSLHALTAWLTCREKKILHLLALIYELGANLALVQEAWYIAQVPGGKTNRNSLPR